MPVPDLDPQRSRQAPLTERDGGRWPALLLLLVTLLFLAVAAWIVSIRTDSFGALGRFVFVIQTVLAAGGIAALWLASALGWGRLWRPALRGASQPIVLQLGCGIATLLWLEHALGWVGLLTIRPFAWALAGVGLALVVHQIGNAQLAAARLPRLHPIALLTAPPAAILVVAAASMPGWLWNSENYGFDALEYHLQLPAEWLASGRLTSLHHNVYSYLPGYLEAAYLHIAAAFGSVYAAGGLVLLSAQFLHAALTVTLALVAGCFVAERMRARDVGGSGGGSAAFAGTLAVVAILSAPYTQVDGSMAYNEMGLNVLFLVGLIAALEPALSTLSRGAVVGWLAGVAAGVKLTAIFMVAAPLALLLLVRPRERRALVPCGAMGFLALLPYFLRNGLDTGDPVFPFATKLFGLGHWTAEQLARWNPSHRFSGTLPERLSLAWSQGAAHPLWSVFFLLVLVAAVAACVLRESRPIARPLILVLVFQLACWTFLTHLLARFLLPVLPVAGILVGLAGGTLHARARSVARRTLVAAGVCLAILPMTVASLRNVAVQRRGDPALFIGADAFDLRTGRWFVEHPELAADAPIEFATNFLVPEHALVYFIGESRVLYAMGPKIYNTPWDESLLGQLMRRHPGDPQRWARGLAERGVTHVRVSLAELDRIQRVDKYSDPLVSRAVVEDFLARFGRPVARKEGISALVELVPPRASTGSTP